VKSSAQERVSASAKPKKSACPALNSIYLKMKIQV
jgi:hypothetical protein